MDINPVVFIKLEDQNKQKQILLSIFESRGIGEEKVQEHIKILNGYKDMYDNNLVGLEFDKYNSWQFYNYSKLLEKNKIQQYGQNISKYSVLLDKNIELDNSNKRIWFLDIEIDNFTNLISDNNKNELDAESESDSGKFDDLVQDQRYPVISITIFDNIDNIYMSFVLNPNNQTNLKDSTIYKLKDYENVFYILCKDELELFVNFSNFIKNVKPEVISGWYSNEFDMPYLVLRSEKLFTNVDMSLLPGGENLMSLIDGMKVTVKKIYHRDSTSWNVVFPGIELIDYLQFYKKFGNKSPQSYGLDYIQKYEGIEGKTEKKGFMNYYKNFDKYLEYIVRDVVILKELEDKNSIIKMLFQLQQMSKIPLWRLFNVSMIVEQMIYLQTYHTDKIVIQSNRINDSEDTSFQGAIVLDPEDKLSDNVIVLDYESLYPNVIRSFNISPETLLINNEYEKQVRDGKKILDFTDMYDSQNPEIHKIGYSLEKVGIMPHTVNMLISERIRYKNLYKNQQDDDPQKQEYYLKQWNFKIVLNSMYGFLGFKFSPLFNKVVAESITAGQRFMFNMQKDSIQDFKGQKVIYGDTDSIFYVKDSITNNHDNLEKYINEIQENDKEIINNILIEKLTPYYKNVKKPNITLKIDVDKIFKRVRFFGVKKRYYGYGFDGKEIMHGVELVRSDTPNFQKSELYKFFRLAIDNKLSKDILLNSFDELKKDDNIQDFGESKGISKNNYTNYSIIPYHVRGLLFQKELGLVVPDLITDKLLILPIKIWKYKNPELFEKQRQIFKFTKKKSRVERVNISQPIDMHEQFKELIEKSDCIELDFQELFDKHILKKLEQFSDLKPMLNEIRMFNIRNELETDNLSLFTL